MMVSDRTTLRSDRACLYQTALPCYRIAVAYASLTSCFNYTLGAKGPENLRQRSLSPRSFALKTELTSEIDEGHMRKGPYFAAKSVFEAKFEAFASW
jgi:hypothetical protein